MNTSNTPSLPGRDQSAYRGATTGATYRRRELLRRRRDEFADLPDGMRSVYVSRVARATAGLMAALGGALVIGANASPDLGAWLEGVIPGPSPAVLLTLLVSTWVAGCLFYLAGWALAERRFTRAMLRAVKPTEDLHHDVERLSHVTPGAVASGMTLSWETASAALPVLAFATVVPATVVYLFMAATVGGYVDVVEFETALAGGADWLAAFAGLGTVAALFCVRLRRARLADLFVQRAIAWTTLFVSVTGGVGAAFSGWSTVAAVSGAVAFIAALCAWATGRVRKDRLVTDCRDGDTASTASVASTLRQVRDGVADVRALIRERGVVGALADTARAARARLALGKRLGALIKAPLSWSFTTVASVAVAAVVVTLAAQLGSSTLSYADGTGVDTTPTTHTQVPWNPDRNIVEPTVEPKRGTAVLYTASPTGSQPLGRLLVIDFERGVFARTDIAIDLTKLPCGDVPADANWETGTIDRTDDELSLMNDELYVTELDVTSTGTSTGTGVPLELRTDDNTVFTPCMVAHDVDVLDVAGTDNPLLLE